MSAIALGRAHFLGDLSGTDALCSRGAAVLVLLCGLLSLKQRQGSLVGVQLNSDRAAYCLEEFNHQCLS